MKNKNNFVILSVVLIFSLAVSMSIVSAQKNPKLSTSDNINDPADDVLLVTGDVTAQVCDTTPNYRTKYYTELFDKIILMMNSSAIEHYEWIRTGYSDEYYANGSSVNNTRSEENKTD